MIHFFFPAISCSPGGLPAPGRLGLFSGSHYMQRQRLLTASRRLLLTFLRSAFSHIFPGRIFLRLPQLIFFCGGDNIVKVSNLRHKKRERLLRFRYLFHI